MKRKQQIKNSALVKSLVRKETATLCRESEVWRECAAQMSRNADFYRGLLDECAKHLGEAVYIADDGTMMDEPLRLKVPELVGAMRRESDGRAEAKTVTVKNLTESEGGKTPPLEGRVGSASLDGCSYLKPSEPQLTTKFRSQYPGATYTKLIQVGWTDALLREHGMIV
jgi:hypothetical protein